MKSIVATRMNAEDSFVTRIFLGFMTTPLLLIVLAGTVQAFAAA